ncbi:hypothetical protein GCM10027217_00820 [Pseudomaricurvus hydrocarbonicus]
MVHAKETVDPPHAFPLTIDIESEYRNLRQGFIPNYAVPQRRSGREPVIASPIQSLQEQFTARPINLSK